MATDYRSLFDRAYIAAFDLGGKDVVVKIARVEGQVLNNGKSQNKKPVIFFEGRERGFVANKTNCKAISGMYGTKVESWIGKLITLFPTVASMGGEQVEAIRVRPTIPVEPKGKAKAEREPGGDDA